MKSVVKERVLLFGSISRDSIVYGSNDALERLGGSVVYIGALLARLGFSIVPVARVGSDIKLSSLRTILGADADLRYLQRSRSPATRVGLYYEGEALRDVHVVWGEAYAFNRSLTAAVAETCFVHVGPESLQNQIEVAKLAQSAAVPLAFDPHADYDFTCKTLFRELLPNTDFLFCNSAEACLLTGKSTINEAILKLKAVSKGSVCIMKGCKGASFLSQDYQRIDISAYPASVVVEPVGAGDTFQGGFIFGSVLGLSLREVLRLAAYFASKAVQGFGVDERLAGRRSPSRPA